MGEIYPYPYCSTPLVVILDQLAIYFSPYFWNYIRMIPIPSPSQWSKLHRSLLLSRKIQGRSGTERKIDVYTGNVREIAIASSNSQDFLGNWGSLEKNFKKFATDALLWVGHNYSPHSTVQCPQWSHEVPKMSYPARVIPEAFPPVARVPHINGGFSLQQKLLGPVFPNIFNFFPHPKVGAQNYQKCRATAAANDPDKMASISGLGTFPSEFCGDRRGWWQ